jgi:predicted PurR-regulated permease PerM
MSDDTTSGQNASPGWGSTTKLVVGLTVVAIIAALLVRFRFIIGPIILAFVLAYLLSPLVARLSKSLRLSWRFSVNIVYVLLVIILAGLIVVLGFVIVQQVQSLLGALSRIITELPVLIRDMPKIYQVGPFMFDLEQLQLSSLASEYLPNLQSPLLQVGSVISALASGTLGTLGWTGFVLIISYFLLSEMNVVSDAIVPIDVPGYNEDFRKLGHELREIWNAFLRGQVIVIVLVMIVYSLLFLILGVRYSLALAVLAGLSRLVPYLGPITAWGVVFLVTFFQNGNYFGLEQWAFALLVVAISFLVDQIFDQIISPRLLGATLGVHPAALLVVAIMAANLLGIVGLVLAAPVLATLQLAGRYTTRKMLELDPFPPDEDKTPGSKFSLRRMATLWRLFQRKLRKY